MSSDETPASPAPSAKVVLRQAANRLPTEQALLRALCSGNRPEPQGSAA